MSTRAYRFAVTVEYRGVFELDPLDMWGGEPDDDDLEDYAVDVALDGGARDKTIVEAEVEPLTKERDE